MPLGTPNDGMPVGDLSDEVDVRVDEATYTEVSTTIVNAAGSLGTYF